MSDASASALELLDSVMLPSARGGRKAGVEVSCRVVRALRAEDLPALANPPALGSSTPGILQLRHGHHKLAQLLAKGLSQTEAALQTGYSPSRVSLLRDDPSFQELEAHYRNIEELVFVDAAERMKALGLSATDELQRRLDEEPESFSNGQLLAMQEVNLLKGRASPGSSHGGTAAGGPGVQVNVSFVAPAAEAPVVIEGEVQKS